MEDQNEHILKEMEETRTSLTQKLEALENQRAGKVQAGADVVGRTTEAAAEIVDNVKETVHEVTEKVEQTFNRVADQFGQTVQSFASLFDIRLQTERHPWVVMGLATVAGCVAGNVLGRSSRPGGLHRTTASHVRSRPHKGVPNGSARGGDGASHPAEPLFGRRSTDREPQSFWQQPWFKEELERLKGLALGTLLGLVRDMARDAVPGAVGDRIAEEVDAFTRNLGAEPIASPVLGEIGEHSGGTGESGAVNRVFSGKGGQGNPWSEDPPGGEAG